MAQTASCPVCAIALLTRDKIAIRDILVLRLSCSFQISGIGRHAKRTSVKMLNMLSVPGSKSQFYAADVVRL